MSPPRFPGPRVEVLGPSGLPVLQPHRDHATASHGRQASLGSGPGHPGQFSHLSGDWSSDVCSSDLFAVPQRIEDELLRR